jgi:hypothetical protein
LNSYAAPAAQRFSENTGGRLLKLTKDVNSGEHYRAIAARVLRVRGCGVNAYERGPAELLGCGFQKGSQESLWCIRRRGD